MKTSTLLMTTALVMASIPATAAVVTGNVIGTSEADIRAALESNGYMVQSVTEDGDEIEVEALFNGQPVEIELSATTGAVMEVEDEHEDGDDTDEADDAEDDDEEDEAEDDADENEDDDDEDGDDDEDEDDD